MPVAHGLDRGRVEIIECGSDVQAYEGLALLLEKYGLNGFVQFLRARRTG